jgi:hypothetical protein
VTDAAPGPLEGVLAEIGRAAEAARLPPRGEEATRVAWHAAQMRFCTSLRPWLVSLAGFAAAAILRLDEERRAKAQGTRRTTHAAASHDASEPEEGRS